MELARIDVLTLPNAFLSVLRELRVSTASTFSASHRGFSADRPSLALRSTARLPCSTGGPRPSTGLLLGSTGGSARSAGLETRSTGLARGSAGGVGCSAEQGRVAFGREKHLGVAHDITCGKRVGLNRTVELNSTTR